MVLAKQQEEFKFCVELSRMLDSQELIIYGDEASFNCWMRSKRTWSTKEEPIKVVLNEKRNSGITVYGAPSVQPWGGLSSTVQDHEQGGLPQLPH